MKQIKIKEISLAAFLKMQQVKLVKIDKNIFIFESKISEQEWKFKFFQSEFSKFDREVRDLKWLIKN